MTFGFDLARWPGGGIDHGIDLTGNSKQLPTLILFDNGGEVERMPRCSRQGVIENRVLFSKANVVRKVQFEKEYREERRVEEEKVISERERQRKRNIYAHIATSNRDRY